MSFSSQLSESVEMKRILIGDMNAKKTVITNAIKWKKKLDPRSPWTFGANRVFRCIYTAVLTSVFILSFLRWWRFLSRCAKNKITTLPYKLFPLNLVTGGMLADLRHRLNLGCHFTSVEDERWEVSLLQLLRLSITCGPQNSKLNRQMCFSLPSIKYSMAPLRFWLLSSAR